MHRLLRAARLLLLTCALSALATPATTQPATPVTGADGPTPPAMRATRVQGEIVLDGVLEEAAWQSAAPATAFTQRDPHQGQPPTFGTEVRLLYDDTSIYIGARMFDDAPDSIVARLSRRDNDSGSDEFSVMFDTFHDKTTGYYFSITAAGTLLDGVMFNDGWDDDSWDGVWHGHVHHDDQGWTAEMRIPLSQVRFKAKDAMTWGVNFQRILARRNESSALIYTPRGKSGFVSRFPELAGLDGVRSGRRIEITPYMTSKQEYFTRLPGDPFSDGSRFKPAGGADVRTSLGSNLTLNATINPDFGQVEIDPAQVNLSDVETFFSEKRPFFVEGTSVFRTGNNGANDYWNFNWPEPVFFYSRRVGRTPADAPKRVSYIDASAATRILGAAKITGQLGPGLKFGTMHAVTAKEQARFDLNGSTNRYPIEPMAYYGVLRGLKELNDRRQGLGLMTTMSARSFSGAEPLENALNKASGLAVVDGWTFLDQKRAYVVSGWAAGSIVSGTEARITQLQRSSAHYYQRPDVGYLGVDTSATSLGGYGARLWLNKQQGAMLLNSAIGMISPGFDNNDLGFTSRGDVINSHFGLGHQWNDPKGRRQYANTLAALFGSWDSHGTPNGLGIYHGGNLELTNRWSINGNYTLSPRSLSVRRTRGGPVMEEPAGVSYNAYFDTNGRNPWFWSISGSGSTSEDGSHDWSAGPYFRWRPMSNLGLEWGMNYGESLNDAQYLFTRRDPAATPTFGARYVFAELDQKTASAEIRADWAVTPNLSLQVYAQPFISSGQYREFKQLRRGRSYDFLVFGSEGSTFDPATGTVDPDGSGPQGSFSVGKPDFTFRTVRSNFVLRWEYMPGSTAFLVWTQDRTGDLSDGRFDLNRSLAGLSHTEPGNVFLVKLSHHFEL